MSAGHSSQHYCNPVHPKPRVRISTGMTPSTLTGVKVTFLNTCGHHSNGGVHVEPESQLVTSLEAGLWILVCTNMEITE